LNGSQADERKFYFLLVAWGLLLVLFLWSLGEVLGPFILFLVLIYLLSPFYGTKVYGRVVSALGFLTLLWLVWTAGWILTPFVLAFVIAYVLNPVVNKLEREGLGRSTGTTVVLVTFLILLVMAIALLGPVFTAQVANFVSKLPEFLEGAVNWLQGLVNRISHIPLPGLSRVEVGQILNIDVTNLGEYVSSQQEAIRRYLLSGVIGVGKGLRVALTVLSYLLVTPILTFFLLRDFDKLVRGVGALVPVQRRPRTFDYFRRFDILLGRFLRSQVLISILVGIVIGVGFWIAGFPFALLLGVIAGIFNIVPYLGFIVTVLPAVLIALVSGNVAVGLLKVALVFGVEQFLENVFSPRIVGQSVGLHPVWVMLSIVLFAFFLGPIGLLIAVPAAVAIKLLLSGLMDSYRASMYYQGPPPAVTLEAAGIEMEGEA
jgi:predicted PurR-regulated permease PerM